MDKKYDVQAIINTIKQSKEMDPDKHDGCYELLRETIRSYSEIADYSIIDYNDLNLVYLTTVGTWRQSIDSKKQYVKNSHLTQNEKDRIINLWDTIWKKACNGEYSNNEASAKYKYSIGLFGTGFFTFKGKTTDGDAQSFIKMCVDILPLEDDDAMFEIVSEYLKPSFHGMSAASASMILHCLKPYTFPILNGNVGYKNIFEILGIKLDKINNIESYIDNCRAIKAYRDNNFKVKNYRIFDNLARDIEQFAIARKTWLLSWNKDNWDWDDFEKICRDTKEGISHKEAWACSNSGPEVGEEVFLIKLGDQPRGIIGHGFVESTVYEKDHYDSEKAAEGKKEKCIDVSFDRLIDYEHETFISQDELNSECPGQHWSPQASGIEIKKDVIPKLLELWNAVTKDQDDWWPSLSEYNPGLTAEEYKELFMNEQIVKRSWLEVIYDLYCMPEHAGTCKQLGNKYGHAAGHYNRLFSLAGEKIMKEKGISSPDDDKNAKHWPVLFYGRAEKNPDLGIYSYKLREPVAEAIEMLLEDGMFNEENDKTMVRHEKNLILYGPPGTGKTYNSVIYSVAICERKTFEEVKKEPHSVVLKRFNDLKKEGRIAFTTFHQSYGYEEFIEGIKPKLDPDNDKTIGYVIEDGIFKSFCKRAGSVNIQISGNPLIKKYPKIWGMILDGTGMTDLKRKCFDNNQIRLGWSEVAENDSIADWDENDNISKIGKQMVYNFRYVMEVGDIVVIEKTNKSIDAIGVITGDYAKDEPYDGYFRSRSVEWLAKDIDVDVVPYLPNGRKQLSRFSLFQFDYIGIDAISKMLIESGKNSIEVERETKPFVFVIDEINRGNISKIFGELITLIESNKRAGSSEQMETILPYSGETFSVPNNVYILGTMNTADRSIALMDTALRRRFEFIEMMPDSEVLNSLGIGTIEVEGEKLNVANMLDTINRRIEFLFDREHTIGHSYFIKLAKDLSLEKLADIFEKNIVPLLQEYFYEDYEKIQLVLGDNDKEDEFKFILDSPVKVNAIFKGKPDVDIPEKRYIIQHDAFRKIESYRQI